MYELYGTFLTHQVEERIKEEGPLTLREIVEKIAPQLRKKSRERNNLYHRVRRAVLYLYDEKRIQREWDFSSNNIPIQKFLVHETTRHDQADEADDVQPGHAGAGSRATAADG